METQDFPIRPEDREMEPVRGIFDDIDTKLFKHYRVKTKFTGMVLGGVPQKPEIIESWLRQRILGGDQELRLMMLKTLDDLDVEVPMNATLEEIVAASKPMAAARNGNTFRRDERGLFLSDYQPKAMLKEATNILFPGERWGAKRRTNAKGEDVSAYQGKSPKSYLAERVFVDTPHIHLGRTAPDGTLMQVGHVTGAQGPRSTLTYIDYCIQPEIDFILGSLEDCISKEQWYKILELSQSEGLGSLRSMGYGRFKVTEFAAA